jgi:hypothetical protein
VDNKEATTHGFRFAQYQNQVLARRFSLAGVRRSFEAGSYQRPFGTAPALLKIALALDLVLEQILWWS